MSRLKNSTRIGIWLRCDLSLSLVAGCKEYGLVGGPPPWSNPLPATEMLMALESSCDQSGNDKPMKLEVQKNAISAVALLLIGETTSFCRHQGKER